MKAKRPRGRPPVALKDLSSTEHDFCAELARTWSLEAAARASGISGKGWRLGASAMLTKRAVSDAIIYYARATNPARAAELRASIENTLRLPRPPRPLRNASRIQSSYRGRGKIPLRSLVEFIRPQPSPKE